MKKTFLLFCTVILLVCFLSGCVILVGTDTSSPDGSVISDGASVTKPDNTKSDNAGTEDTVLKTLQSEIARSGAMAGVAFIGYVSDESSEVDLRTFIKNSKTGNEYPFLSDAPLYMAQGDELYAIIPINKRGIITVYSSSVTGDGEYVDDKSEPLHKGKAGEIVILKCNFSEIYSNVLITATDGGGAFEFRPSISLENGWLAEIPGVYDFSVYEKTSAECDERSVEIAMEILRETDEVKWAMEHGMKLMYTGDMQTIAGRCCLLFALGTDHDGQFVKEQIYGVCDNLVFAYDALNDTWTVLGVS